MIFPSSPPADVQNLSPSIEYCEKKETADQRAASSYLQTSWLYKFTQPFFNLLRSIGGNNIDKVKVAQVYADIQRVSSTKEDISVTQDIFPKEITTLATNFFDLIEDSNNAPSEAVLQKLQCVIDTDPQLFFLSKWLYENSDTVQDTIKLSRDTVTRLLEFRMMLSYEDLLSKEDLYWFDAMVKCLLTIDMEHKEGFAIRKKPQKVYDLCCKLAEQANINASNLNSLDKEKNKIKMTGKIIQDLQRINFYIDTDYISDLHTGEQDTASKEKQYTDLEIVVTNFLDTIKEGVNSTDSHAMEVWEYMLENHPQEYSLLKWFGENSKISPDKMHTMLQLRLALWDEKSMSDEGFYWFDEMIKFLLTIDMKQQKELEGENKPQVLYDLYEELKTSTNKSAQSVDPIDKINNKSAMIKKVIDTVQLVLFRDNIYQATN